MNYLQHLLRVIENQRLILELEEQCSELNKSLTYAVIQKSELTKVHRFVWHMQRVASFWLNNLEQQLIEIRDKLYSIELQKEALKRKSDSIQERFSRFNSLNVFANQKAIPQQLLCSLVLRLETRRKILLAQLHLLYPINVPDGGKRMHYSIRDIDIPSHQPQNIDDDAMSSALGYVCHLVLMIAKYFSIALRYKIHYRGSRSYISDEVSPIKGLTEYPLYMKGVERAKFECAVILLNRVVDQILRNRNINAAVSQIRLENPTRLFDNLFRFFQSERPESFLVRL